MMQTSKKAVHISSLLEQFSKKVFLKSSKNLQENNCDGVPFEQSCRLAACTIFKNQTAWVFPVNFTKFQYIFFKISPGECLWKQLLESVLKNRHDGQNIYIYQRVSEWLLLKAPQNQRYLWGNDCQMVAATLFLLESNCSKCYENFFKFVFKLCIININCVLL